MNFFKKKHLQKINHPVIILSTCLLLTIIISILTQKVIKEKHYERLEQISEVISNKILSRINKYERSLNHLHAYFKASPNLTKEGFKTYIDNLQVDKNYSGIQGLGYSVRIDKSDLASYEAGIKAEGFKNFKVWPDYPREEYHAIHFLEPQDWRNKKAFGFDMFTQESRFKAMSKARDSAAAAITSVTTLVQEGKNNIQPGFLIYYPLYKGKTVPESITERRKQLLGFVYAPFRTFNFFKNIFLEERATNKEFNIEIFDGSNNSPDFLLFSNDLLKNKKIKNKTNIKISNIIHPVDHEWTVVTTYRQNKTLQAELILPWIVFFIGLLLSFLIYWIFYSSKNYTLETTKSLTRFNALIENLTEGLIFISPAGTIQIVNKVALEIFNHSSDFKTATVDSFIENFIFLDLNQDEISTQNTPFYRALNGEKFSNYELEVSGKGISENKFMSFGGTPVFDNNDILTLVVITVRDITEKKQSEIRLKEAVVARDEFLSISSHELKTPLTSIKLTAQMLKRKLQRNKELTYEETLKFVELTNQQVVRLSRLVDDMLDISRLRSGHFSLSLEEVNLCEVVDHTLDQMKSQFIDAGYEMPLFTRCNKAVGHWDPLRLEQVVTNLLTNAIRYGQGNPITISVELNGEYVRLIVKDKGNGMSENQKKRIFNRFERLTELHETTGLGIGLYLTKKIVSGHKGSIWVESEENHGSSFYVELPH